MEMLIASVFIAVTLIGFCIAIVWAFTKIVEDIIISIIGDDE